MRQYIIFLFLFYILHAQAETTPSCVSPYSVNLVTGEFSEISSDIILNSPIPVILERKCSSKGWEIAPRSLLGEHNKGKLGLVSDYDALDRLTSVKVVSEDSKIFGQASLTYTSTSCELELNHGQKWTFHYSHPDRLEKVILPNLAEWNYQYTQHPDTHEYLLSKKEEADGRFLLNEYYIFGENSVGDILIIIDDPDDNRIGRIKLQKAPAGNDANPRNRHSSHSMNAMLLFTMMP